MSRCGMAFERRHADAAVDVLAERNGEARLRSVVNSSRSSIWRSAMTSRLVLGTSMPTVGLPGMRSMRIDSACRPRHRSSVRFVMRLYLMPASGLNSKVVTTGPGLICTTLPSTLNSSNLRLDLDGGVFEFLLVVGAAAGRLVQQFGGRQREDSAECRLLRGLRGGHWHGHGRRHGRQILHLANRDLFFSAAGSGAGSSCDYRRGPFGGFPRRRIGGGFHCGLEVGDHSCGSFGLRTLAAWSHGADGRAR